MDNELEHKIKHSILERVNYNMREAAWYARNQAFFYAKKADRYRDHRLYEKWRRVYRIYSSLAFRFEYYNILDESESFSEANFGN